MAHEPLQRRVMGVLAAERHTPPQQAAQALPDRALAAVTRTAQVVEAAVPVRLVSKGRRLAQ